MPVSLAGAFDKILVISWHTDHPPLNLIISGGGGTGISECQVSPRPPHPFTLFKLDHFQPSLALPPKMQSQNLQGSGSPHSYLCCGELLHTSVSPAIKQALGMMLPSKRKP